MTIIVSGNLFAAELEKLVRQKIEDHTTNIKTGVAIHNIESYRELVGKIASLEDVLEMMKEAQDIVDRTR